MEKFDNTLYIDKDIYKSLKYITLSQNKQFEKLIINYLKNNT